MSRRRTLILIAAALVIAAAIGAAIYFRRPHKATGREIAAQAKTEAPPDLEKLRPAFGAGLQALHDNDGAEAVRQFSSFTFGNRAVEEYRLYFLANGHQLAGDRRNARIALAQLWHRTPKLAYWEEVGINLADLYSRLADWHRSGDASAAVAERTDSSPIAASARWTALEARFCEGDPAAVLDNARSIIIRTPTAAQAADAMAIIRSLQGLGPNDAVPLTPAERLERGVALLRDGDPQHAYDELTALDAAHPPESLRLPVQLNRGLALNQLRRFEDSSKILDPLASGPYRIAIPALYHAAKNYRILSDSVNPIVLKTVLVRQQVGTIKVKAKGKKKATTRPKFAKVKKTIQLIDLPKKAKKDAWDHLSTERLKDLLQLPLADPVRVEVLSALIGLAESKNQDEYEQQLIPQLIKLDPLSDPGLQHFWDKAWAAWSRGDLHGAEPLLTFIRTTYRNPNVRRQSTYWYARTAERLGRKDEAAQLYRELAAAPYADLYALNAQAHGAPRQENPTNPIKANRPDWRELAEKNMPAELRLAYELTALFDMRDASLEMQRNRNPANQHYADALLADLYHSAGRTEDLYKTLRRAFPQLATVEQDSVPPYFLKMYYPMKYEEAIRKFSSRNGVDPYTIMALILQESYYNPKAKSPVGATGLMQLMPATGKELGSRLGVSPKLDNPDVNIELGTYHFKMLMNLFGGNVQLAVASYNAGQGNVLKWKRAAPGKPLDELLESIPFAETRNYVKRVTLLAATYKRLNS